MRRSAVSGGWQAPTLFSKLNALHVDTIYSIILSLSKAQKLIEAMANNPQDWQIDQVKTVANASGLTVHCPGGSHHVVRNAAGAKISIPAHRPIKAIYIKQLIRMIKAGKGDTE